MEILLNKNNNIFILLSKEIILSIWESERIFMDVLVYVITYNHENYIEQCIHSIMSQKCSFDFKVAVFDDASTDRTRDILNKLKFSYKEKLILNFPSCNMFSQEKYNMHWKYLGNMEEAKYIAFCEGDDFWNDNSKLQLQYEIMEKNQDCSVCVHLVDLYDELKKKFTHRIPDMKWLGICAGKQKSDVLIRKQLEYGNMFSYNSYFWRAKFFYKENFDNLYWDMVLGDFITFMYLAIKGEVFVIDASMAVKRVNNLGTFSYQANYSFHIDCEKKIENLEKEILMLKRYDEMSKGKFAIYIENAIVFRHIKIKMLKESEKIDIECVNPYTGKRIRNRIHRKINHLYIKVCKKIYANNPEKLASIFNCRLKKALNKY